MRVQALRQLTRIVEETDTTAGRGFDLAIQGLIVISLVAFAVETLPALSTGSRQGLRLLEIAVALAFTAEYLLRILVADRPLRFGVRPAPLVRRDPTSPCVAPG
ncbi:MAG: hypothetical protein ACRD2Z_13550 [Thermoanaerobaculia bacterium]